MLCPSMGGASGFDAEFDNSTERETWRRAEMLDSANASAVWPDVETANQL